MIANWHASGGEPDIGVALPHMLAEAGLTVEFIRPVVFTARPSDFVWQWPATFVRSHAQVLAETGAISAEEAHAVDAILTKYDAQPDALTITPGVLQIVARKPR